MTEFRGRNPARSWGRSPNRVDFKLPRRPLESSPAFGGRGHRVHTDATGNGDAGRGIATRSWNLVRRGLPFAAFENLVRALGASQQDVASAVGMPATTLGRRRKNGRLTPVESDHVVRIARLAALARQLMAGDPNAASAWLTTPHALLGDETPLALAATETGGREVERLIGQLRHGVFS